MFRYTEYAGKRYIVLDKTIPKLYLNHVLNMTNLRG